MIARIYDFLQRRKMFRRTSLVCLTVALILSLLQLSYKEDITDFLPLTEEEKVDMEIYQDISGANKLVILFTGNKENPDSTIEAVDCFYDIVKKADTQHWTKDMTTKFDMEKVSAVTDFVYQNIPYFLTEKDYARMDSVLCSADNMAKRLDGDKEMLMFPSGGLLSSNISRDPLNLFTPVVARLQGQQQENKFEMYDGYIFTPDMTKAIVMLTSPFGNAETSQNAKLMNLLEEGIAKMNVRYPHIEAHILGGPQIAVGNADQIKQDSILAVTLAVVLILVLLTVSFHSVRNILLIVVSIGWGWLLALGCIALFRDNISMIVVGISSIIVGIAVNYPLHLIAHTDHQPDIRAALKEICAPLLVGNITTVGAFVALIPLDSTALRDLGLFASLLLLGTIFFVLIYLPHLIAAPPSPSHVQDASGGNQTAGKKNVFDRLIRWGNRIIDRVAEVQLDNKPWLVYTVIVLTLIFGWFSLQIEFDSNISNINYMTRQQHEDMDYFQRLTADGTGAKHDKSRTVYVVSSAGSMDAALDSCLKTGVGGVSQFLVSEAEQKSRLDRWNTFCERYHETLYKLLPVQAKEAGFSADAFADFYGILDAKYVVHPFSYFEPLTTTVFAQNISVSSDRKRYSVIDKMDVDEKEVEAVENRYHGSFDIESLNSRLADSLSDNFNYIGWACSLIVFFFLWFSFRRLELAVISFVPMAVSWLWILGIMALLGIKFNIVNIILATFIFGQGDDYTIFMTEGCLYEHETGKPILTSYKRSILLSACIMFIGIGTLIVAQHPALHSLAEVTIVGMFSVVIMSWLIPPFLFRLMMRYKSRKSKV